MTFFLCLILFPNKPTSTNYWQTTIFLSLFIWFSNYSTTTDYRYVSIVWTVKARMTEQEKILLGQFRKLFYINKVTVTNFKQHPKVLAVQPPVTQPPPQAAGHIALVHSLEALKLLEIWKPKYLNSRKHICNVHEHKYNK